MYSNLYASPSQPGEELKQSSNTMFIQKEKEVSITSKFSQQQVQQQPMIQNTSSYKPQPYAIQHSIYSDQRAQSMHPQFQQAFSTQFQQQQQQSQAPPNPPIIIKTTESPKQQVAKVSLVQSKRSSHRFSKRKQRKNSESDQSVDGNNENFCGVHFQSSQIQKEQFENSQNKQAEGNYGLCQIF